MKFHQDPVEVTPRWKPEPSAGGMGLPKRKSKKRASAERWKEIRASKLGSCIVCLWLGERQTLPSSIHHPVAKSLGGSDTEANAVSCCGDGTTGHHGLIEAHDVKTCQAFAAALQQYDDQAYSYAVAKLGEDGFLRRYKVAFVCANPESDWVADVARDSAPSAERANQKDSRRG